MGLRETLDAALKAFGTLHPCCLKTDDPHYEGLLGFLVEELTTGPCVLCQKPGELRADSNRVMCQECYSLQWLTESHKNYPSAVKGAPMPHHEQPSYGAPFASEPSSQDTKTGELWEKDAGNKETP